MCGWRVGGDGGGGEGGGDGGGGEGDGGGGEGGGDDGGGDGGDGEGGVGEGDVAMAVVTVAAERAAAMAGTAMAAEEARVKTAPHCQGWGSIGRVAPGLPRARVASELRASHRAWVIGRGLVHVGCRRVCGVASQW